MSLTGNLEDLPLLDILQLVSFSRKTGVLAILGDTGESGVIFREGFVVAAYSGGSLPPDPRARTLSPEKREAMLRNRIEMSLEQLIRLREGQFSFSLADEVPERVGSRDISEERLPDGINAQELLLDLAKGMDEGRRDSMAALEASFAGPVEDISPGVAPEGFEEEFALSQESLLPDDDADVAEPVRSAEAALAESPQEQDVSRPLASPTLPEVPTVLLVDDEEEVRNILAGHFTSAGYQVVEACDPESAVKKAGRLGKAGIPFRLVTDLGMPTSGGASFHGGFEVVKRMWKMNLHPPVLLMTDSLNGALQARARQMGIKSIIFKPGLSKLDPEQFVADLNAFAKKILADILPTMTEPAPPPAKAARASASASPREPPTAEDLSRELAALERSLQELRGHGEVSEIATLVMKVAQEFFERAMFFVVKNDEVRGLWGFGPAPREENLNLLARDIIVPLTEPSLFLDVVVSRRPFNGALPEGKWSQYLMGKIGRFKSQDVTLLPLMTNREIIAVLFGDNPETGRDLRRLDSLNVFVNQAGIALENAFLQRKLLALQGRGMG